jgi:hypothetical protein
MAVRLGAGARATGNVLVVYAQMMHPLRSTIEDHLYAFRRHSRRRVFYLNARVLDVPRHVLRRRYDLIVFHTSFLGHRWDPEQFAELCERAKPLKALAGVRVAMPQDEFLRTRLVCDFIDDFDIDVVCSVAPESEWPTIYPTVDRDRVRFHRILTGYLDARTKQRIDELVATGGERDIDIGYRAWRGAFWLGRHGTLKGTIAEAVAAAGSGLRLDVSTRDEDTLNGDDWFRFLARCRYTIGMEGGASVLDFDGTFKERTERYLAEHPDASFDEVERACFPGEDGKLALYALSPRHLEACATRTCQILVRGGYNGVLEAGRHYIELEPDLSNVATVLGTLDDEARRSAIVDAAYADVVTSGRYSYAAMVEEVERFAPSAPASAPASAGDRAALALNRATDRLAWVRVVYALRWRRLLVRPLLRPVGVFRSLVHRVRWSRAAGVVAAALPAAVKRRLQRHLGGGPR